MGTLLNVLVIATEVIVLLDFAVVRMENQRKTCPTLLGRPWLLATKAIQDWGRHTFTLPVGEKTVIFPLCSDGPKKRLKTKAEPHP